MGWVMHFGGSQPTKFFSWCRDLSIQNWPCGRPFRMGRCARHTSIEPAEQFDCNFVPYEVHSIMKSDPKRITASSTKPRRAMSLCAIGCYRSMTRTGRLSAKT